MKRTLVYLAVLAVMAGCVASMPSKLTITDDDRVACEVQECAVFSAQEIEWLIRKTYTEGYMRGKQAEKQSL